MTGQASTLARLSLRQSRSGDHWRLVGKWPAMARAAHCSKLLLPKQERKEQQIPECSSSAVRQRLSCCSSYRDTSESSYEKHLGLLQDRSSSPRETRSGESSSTAAPSFPTGRPGGARGGQSWRTIAGERLAVAVRASAGGILGRNALVVNRQSPHRSITLTCRCYWQPLYGD